MPYLRDSQQDIIENSLINIINLCENLKKMKYTATYLLLFTLLIFSSASSHAQALTVHLYNSNNVLLGSYINVTKAYNNIPPTISEPYIIEIDQAYNYKDETYPIIFTKKNGTSDINTITIRLTPSSSIAAFASNDSTQPIMIFDDADHVILDGVYHPMNKGMFFLYDKVTDVKQPFILFKNGACHNTVENANFNGQLSDFTLDAAIELGTSPSNTSGNSDNTIRYNSFMGNSYGVLSKGTPANPNSNNTIFSCSFTALAGIYLREGTGKTTIEKNHISVNSSLDTTSTAGILLEDFTDTISINRNAITISTSNLSSSNNIPGILINGTVQTNNYMLVSNNIITSFAHRNIKDTSITIQEDTVALLSGIHLNSSSKINAGIYHNTISMDGIGKKANTTGITSACILKTGVATGSIIDIKNNILNNKRTNRNAATYDVALAITNISVSMSMDYNVYLSSGGNYTYYNGQAHQSIASHQNAVGNGQESNSNTTPTTFITGTHLTGSMYNKPHLKGVTIPGITTDYQNESRTYPYRGADEISINCSGTATKGTATAKSYATRCSTDSVYVQLTYTYGQNIDLGGRWYQWQSKPLSSNQPFTNIPGAESTTTLVKMKGPTIYRIVDSCLDGSPARYSDPDTALYEPQPVVNSITAKRSGNTYFFSATGVKDVLYYKWKFGDGDSSSSANPVHTYADDKEYRVVLIASNDCGQDYSTITTTMSTDIDNVASKQPNIYPNPANDRLYIELPSGTAGELHIYDYSGKEISASYTLSGNNLIVNSTWLAAGMYILKLITSNEVYTSRFQVLH